MTIWTPSLEGRPGPTYKAIADALAEAIAKGTLSEGDRLPTHRDLAWSLGVTVTTITRAYQEARRRNLISGEVGRGTFVRIPDRDVPLTSHATAFNMPPLQEARDSGIVNLSLNYPPPLGQAEALMRTLRDISHSNSLDQLMSYQPDTGMAAHRAAGARWMGRVGLTVPPENVIVTGGGQHGLMVALTTLCRPGDVVLTEPLTYPGLKAIAVRLDLRLEPVAMDDDGLCPDSLEEAIRQHGPRAACLMPTLHNPTCITMTEARRQTIGAILERHGLYTIEDDVYGMLPSKRPPPLTAFMPRFGVYLTSCSKSMAPGLRVGYIAAPLNLVPRLADSLHSICWMVPPTMAEIASRWIDGGIADQISTDLRTDVITRRTIADEELSPDRTGFSYTSPPEAYHLWMPLPDHWRTEAFVDQVHRMGVAILPAETFAIGRARPPSAVRICLGALPSTDDLRQGLRIVARALESGPDHIQAVI